RMSFLNLWSQVVRLLTGPVLFLVLATQSLAQSSGTLWGRVSDQNGAVISDVFRPQIISVVALFVFQSALILALLMERRRWRKANVGLKESGERLTRMFKSCPQPMWLSTLDEGRYIDVNDSFLEMTGYRREEVIGHTSVELQNWDSPEEFAQIVNQLKV